MVKRARRRSAAARVRLAVKETTQDVSEKPKARHGRQINPRHKNAIAQLFCLATFLRWGIEVYGVHVAHLRFSNHKAGAYNPGVGRKPDDRWTLPLSPAEHRLQHSMGEGAYCAELGIDPHQIAAALWSASPDTEEMAKVLRDQIISAATPAQLAPNARAMVAKPSLP
jgi:hypothetical protein